MANPRGQQRDKPFRDALRMEIAALQEQGDQRGLRRVARALIEGAEGGDIQAIRELADRLDGKVPQGITGDEEGGPLLIATMNATPRDRARALATLVAKAKAG